ncbi:MAG: SGNH/GDSL hydrolase family protein, partial [Thermoanaerobaculia bacterium]
MKRPPSFPGFRTLALLCLCLLAGAPPLAAEPLRLERGDRICIIGNALAEGLQHSGWFETLLHHRFPEHDLVVRNLAFPGDELTLRLRSRDFGSPDDHLAKHQADVVLAFFGYNESFGGRPKLEKFSKDFDRFIQDTLSKRYNGKLAPRLVLCSPIGHERLPDPNLPDGREIDDRLDLYARAMAEAARARGVHFADLLSPSRKLYAENDRPLTSNGIHLNDDGHRLLAPFLLDALVGAEPSPGASGGAGAARDPARLERLRAAVLDRNFHWFHRYRTTDGYSIYGERSHLKFVDGQTNREVMQREMEVLDVMAANRDRRIWAVARGGDLVVDDANTPPFIPVKTNKPGKGPGGAHEFLGGEEAIGRMKVHPGMKVNLFASEERFPEIAKAVQMAFDVRGRLWLACMPSYPHWKPKDPM